MDTFLIVGFVLSIIFFFILIIFASKKSKEKRTEQLKKLAQKRGWKFKEGKGKLDFSYVLGNYKKRPVRIGAYSRHMTTTGPGSSDIGSLYEMSFPGPRSEKIAQEYFRGGKPDVWVSPKYRRPVKGKKMKGVYSLFNDNFIVTGDKAEELVDLDVQQKIVQLSKANNFHLTVFMPTEERDGRVFLFTSNSFKFEESFATRVLDLLEFVAGKAEKTL